MANYFAVASCSIFLFLASSSACNPQDHAALLSFMSSFSDLALYWTTTTTTTDCCSWNYVTCDADTGRVTYLSFSGAYVNLNGPIPASVGDLSALEHLVISDMPNLVGPLPPQLTKLKKLQQLSIYRTRISGPVPSFLSQLPALVRLDLYQNKLVGTIPPSLGSLVNLYSISLNNNQLSGTIPPSLFTRFAAAGSNNIVDLDLSHNKLTGSVPRSFANAPFLILNLQDNHLAGDASFLFGKSKPLHDIMLANNKLEFDLTHVEYPEGLADLDISRNKNIYGSISNQVTQLPKLDSFVVSYNNLCGKIPTGGNLGQFPASYYQHNKCLCGSPLPACK